MRKLIVCLFFNLLFIQNVHAGAVYASQCNTNLKPRDKTSKFIEAIQCLQQVIEELQLELVRTKSDAARAASEAAEAGFKAAAAEVAAARAAQYTQDTNSKLDRMFQKTMK